MSSNKTIHIQVSGMSCGGCTNFVKNTLQNLQGTINVAVSLENATATVVFDNNKIEAQQIIDTLNETHFEVVGSR
ncbi:MAG: heavy-metal-associated domain-containing protein [Chitinophagales bacterium]